MLWVWGGALLVGFSFILKNIILIVVFFWIANSFQHGGNLWSPLRMLVVSNLEKSYRNRAELSFSVQRKKQPDLPELTPVGHCSQIFWWKVKVQLNSPTASMQKIISWINSAWLGIALSHFKPSAKGWAGNVFLVLVYLFFFYFSLFFNLRLDLQPKATAPLAVDFFFQCW